MVWHNAIERGVMVLLMSSEMKKKLQKLMLRGVVAQGPSKSRRIKNVDGYFVA